MGWAAVFGALALPAFLIYASAIVWTIGYDTIYALQDIPRRRDRRRALDRTAVRRQCSHRASARCTAGAVALAEAAVLSAHAHWIAQAGVIAFAAHLAWQISAIRPDDKDRALKLFPGRNRDAGLLLFAGPGALRPVVAGDRSASAARDDLAFAGMHRASLRGPGLAQREPARAAGKQRRAATGARRAGARAVRRSASRARELVVRPAFDQARQAQVALQ